MISVLMPVRDAASTLDDAVASILAQSERDLELVAVDDGSTDGSGERLEAWAARDARVRVLRGPAVGLVAALNRGLDACRAPLVARMDADDVAHPERLAAQRALLEARPDLDVVACQVEAVGVDGSAARAGMLRYVAWLNGLLDPEAHARERFIESPVAHPSVLLRRDALRAAGGYHDRGWPEDYDLWLRLLAGGARFAKVPRVLLAWRDHAARATRTQPSYATERLRAVKLHHLLDGPLAARPPVLFWGAGLEGKPLLRALRAAGVSVPIAIEADPRKVGNVIHGARVIAMADLGAALAAHPDALVLVAVGVPSARPEIRSLLDRAGLREGQRYFFLC